MNRVRSQRSAGPFPATRLVVAMAPALTIGFCGSFTTMSTFSYETVTLMTDGEYWRAGFYITGSIAGTVFAVLAGAASAARLL